MSRVLAGWFVATMAIATPAALASQTLTPDTTARIDAVFARFTPTTPGCALNVLRDGSSIYERGYGAASLELQVPITTRTIFDIGSTSKQFTAASVVLLALDGKLSLDDDIRKYLPELPDLGAKVTLRNLLNHTSGWRDYIDLMVFAGWDERDHTTDRDAVDVLVRQRALNFAPGSDWRYSNTGYFLMSLVVKRVSGRSLADFARERIFEPLGMRDTHYLTDSREVIAGKATAYDPASGGRFEIDMSNWEQIGDGGVQTTVEDLAKWDANFYLPAVGGQKLVDLLQTTATLTNGTPLTYALGLTVDEHHGLRRVQHGGAWGGFRAMTMRFPARHLSVITLCNRGDANTMQLATGVADVFLPAQPMTLAGEPTVRLTTAQASLLAGLYYADATGQLVALEAQGDSLSQRGARVALQPMAPMRFRQPVSGAEWSFFPTPDETGPRLTISTPGSGAPSFFVRVWPTGVFHAADYVGRYDSSEIGTELDVVARGDTLFLHRQRGDDDALRPVFRDAFAGAGVMRFERDAAGRVRALTLTSRGVHALRLPRRD